MIRFLSRILLAACLVAAGCKRVDPASEHRTLLNADRAFAAAALAGEMDRVFSFWTEDAVIYPAGMPVVRGKEEIREFVARNRAQPGFSIQWEPRDSVVSQDGSLGYTIGGYHVSINGPDGSPTIRQGRYLQAWRKSAAGAWKCTLEIQAPLSQAGGPDVRPGQDSR